MSVSQLELLLEIAKSKESQEKPETVEDLSPMDELLDKMIENVQAELNSGDVEPETVDESAPTETPSEWTRVYPEALPNDVMIKGGWGGWKSRLLDLEIGQRAVFSGRGTGKVRKEFKSYGAKWVENDVWELNGMQFKRELNRNKTDKESGIINVGLRAITRLS